MPPNRTRAVKSEPVPPNLILCHQLSTLAPISYSANCRPAALPPVKASRYYNMAYLSPPGWMSGQLGALGKARARAGANSRMRGFILIAVGMCVLLCGTNANASSSTAQNHFYTCVLYCYEMQQYTSEPDGAIEEESLFLPAFAESDQYCQLAYEHAAGLKIMQQMCKN